MSRSKEAARQFRGKRTGSLITIRNCPTLKKYGKKLLPEYCEYPNEQEVLIAPWAKFKIVSLYYQYKLKGGI